MDRATDNITPVQPPRRRRRGLVVAAIVLAAVVLLLFGLLPVLMRPYVRQKLQDTVAAHLHGKLDVGSLTYKFPYGVIVRDASFTTDDSQGNLTILTVKRLELVLDQLPLHKGPLVIKRLTIDEPVIHAVRMENGAMIGAELVRRKNETVNQQARLKLSDILRLREFNLNKASVIYEDRSNKESQRMEWRNLDARLELAPKSASNYGFRFHADNQPIAQIQLNGSADVDELTVTVDMLAMSADIRRDQKTSPLPAQLQDVVRQLGIEGSLKFQISGGVPLRNLTAGNFNLDASLSDVRLRPTSQSVALDHLSADLHAHRTAAASSQPSADDRIIVQLKNVNAESVGAAVQVSDANGTIDLASKSWEVGKIAGKIAATNPSVAAGNESPATVPSVAMATSAPSTRPQLGEKIARYVQAGSVTFTAGAKGSLANRDAPVTQSEFVVTLDHLRIQPPNFARPLENITGFIRLNNNEILLQNISATYGSDQLLLQQAIIPLSELPQHVELRDINASLQLASPNMEYPPPLADVIARVRPTGKYLVSGTFALYLARGRSEPDYALTLVPQGGSATLTDRDITVSELQGEIALAPKLVEIKYLEGKTFGGSVAVKGTIIPRAPFPFQGEITAQNTEMSQVATAFDLKKDDGTPRFSGRAITLVRARGELSKSVSGAGDPLQAFRARGRIHVEDGNFWSGKILDGVMSNVPIARSALTAGQAAAAFDIADRKINLRRAAISSPAIGVQGSGVLGFDGAIDLDVVVAPLGDWRQKISRSGIPIISNVAGQLVGSIQKLVNSATAGLLEFRVRGKLADPQVAAVPTPFLTDNAADLFGMMLRETRADKLIDAIQRKEDTVVPDATTQPATESRIGD